ncbi:predicted protein [Uncinocarpus reesii 1704]|uniref:non-specific serine/threonine protein kinase n=1 Tax=Uncinocarpus reesii (strain UAMH 1704) TaxID=336963 RepID=C4JJQ4_UNCRE|nr:uncharacterized protein UREG_01861 [Uncinocarpus reesii 1704]EEP77012.1 predicted protein [Uncinocarpus reesii 1704]
MSHLTAPVWRLVPFTRPPCHRMFRRLAHQTADHQAIEEQLLPRYHQRQYYPVKIGDTLKDQYRVIAKLGYGAYSTVWLAWDEKASRYASLKVCVQDDGEPNSPILNEISMLQRLKKCAAAEDHPGLLFTRLADDIFEINGPSGRHYCVASKPQAGSVRVLQETFPEAKVPKLLVRSLIHRLFFSVNWLHGNCNTIHTDISPQNVLSEIEDNTPLRDIEEQESQDPSIPIIPSNGAAPVYRSRSTAPELGGIPILTDFSQMRLAQEGGNKEWCMPDIYRAPEVLLKLPFNYPVDMWSIGVMSPDFLTYFNKNGQFKFEAEIPKTSLEGFITTIPRGEEKEQFLSFIRKLLTWDPEARATSSEIILDEWLMRPNETMV